MENATIITEDEAIDVSNYSMSTQHKNRSANVYDKTLCKDNKTLSDFINKCIYLDPTYEMENIINKVLLTAYVCADEDYKKSDQFQRVLTKAFKRLINEPDKKYSHISDVLDTLKLHVKRPPKKKVNLVTLSTTVNPEICNRKRHKPGINHKVRPKKHKPDVIALDDEDDDVIAIENENTEVINHQGKTIAIQEVKIDDPVPTVLFSPENTIEINDSQEIKVADLMQSDVKYNNNIINDDKAILPELERDKENLAINDSDSGNKLLVPLMEMVQVEKKVVEFNENDIIKKIEHIEEEIAKAKDKIDELELAEVTVDSRVSPYVQCDKLQAHIVKLYKELCSLVDEEPVKARKVRLQVTEGQPEGPVRRLERFLNEQIDEDGVAPFPDFHDVVRCVEKANESDNLGWSKAKIFREAQAMFSYCGRALQKRRQGREWRHLRSRLPRECFDHDPAERDAELRAKLELHKRLAVAKESEILERFSRMESMAVLKKVDTNQEDNIREYQTDANITKETMSDTILTELEDSFHNKNNEGSNNETCQENGDHEMVVNIKQEPEEPIKIQYKGDISLVIEISDSDSSGDEL